MPWNKVETLITDFKQIRYPRGIIRLNFDQIERQERVLQQLDVEILRYQPRVTWKRSRIG